MLVLPTSRIKVQVCEKTSTQKMETKIAEVELFGSLLQSFAKQCPRTLSVDKN